MKQNTYYFSHDYNAHNDFKILFMRQQLGMEGYGIYWFLIENLADAGGYLPLKIVPVLAMQMHTSEVKVLAIIKQFELFEIIEDKFFSIRLIEHLEKRINVKNIKSIAGRISAEKRKNSTDAEHMLNTCSTKERKGKEKKVKEIKQIEYRFNSDIFKNKWLDWTEYKKNQFKFIYKSEKSEQIALDNLIQLSQNNEQNAIRIINQSITNGWKGFFNLPKNDSDNRTTAISDYLARSL